MAALHATYRSPNKAVSSTGIRREQHLPSRPLSADIGARRGRQALATAARRRDSSLYQRLHRIVLALQLLQTPAASSGAHSFRGLLTQLERLEVEARGGSQSRSMSTALWLLQRSVPPSVSAPMGSDDFNQALGVLIWLLTHFDGPQEQATVAEPVVLCPSRAMAHEADDGTPLGSPAPLARTPNPAPAPKSRTLKHWEPPARWPTGTSMSDGTSLPVTSPLLGSTAVLGSSLPASTAPLLLAEPGVAKSEPQRLDRSFQFGEVVVDAPPTTNQPLRLRTHTPTTELHLQQMPISSISSHGEPFKVLAGKRTTKLAENSAVIDPRTLEEEGRAACLEAQERALARERRLAARMQEPAPTPLRSRCHGDEALANDTLQRRLAIDERAWREEEAQSRRAEADAVLLREKGLCLAQSARLGLSTSVDAAAGCTAVMGTEETLACPQPLLCATTEMRSLINDLHSSFSLFCTSPSIADDPLSVVSGQIRGGGAVSSSDVELALEAFGQHYLSLAGREALSKIWTAGQVCFADYAQTMLRLMAGFGPGSLALTENEALAALYVAFRLFDYSGSGVVGMADIELVLQALSCHLESHEVSELLGHLQQSGHDPSSELPFHCFLSLFMPTIRAGTELAGRADSEAAASETDRAEHQPSELVLLGGGGTHFAGGGAAGARAQRAAAGESIARSGTLVSHSLHCP